MEINNLAVIWNVFCKLFVPRTFGATCIRYTVGRVLIMWFDYCILSFTSEIANLLVAFVSHEARKVRFKQDTIAIPIIANTAETDNSRLIYSRNLNQSYGILQGGIEKWYQITFE